MLSKGVAAAGSTIAGAGGSTIAGATVLFSALLSGTGLSAVAIFFLGFLCFARGRVISFLRSHIAKCQD